jgi:hypothetical protein
MASAAGGKVAWLDGSSAGLPHPATLENTIDSTITRFKIYYLIRRSGKGADHIIEFARDSQAEWTSILILHLVILRHVGRCHGLCKQKLRATDIQRNASDRGGPWNIKNLGSSLAGCGTRV